MSASSAGARAGASASEDTATAEDTAIARLATLGAELVGTGDRRSYGPDPDQFVELHGDPESASALVIVVHGGYFRPRTNLDHARPMARALADAGALCALVEYRREGGSPNCSDDVSDAIDLVLEQAAAWGMRAAEFESVTVAGHSAGGALVLAWASGLGPHGPRVRLRPLAPVTDLFREVDLGLADDAVLDYMGARPEEDLASYLAEDPRSRAVLIPDRVDVEIIHGDLDATVDIGFSRTFPAPLVALAGAHHADVVDPDSPHFAEVVRRLLP